jgi:prevent-host-death family protein
MAVQILDSNTAHKKLRDLLNRAMTGDMDVIITRYGKPIVAVIPYQDYIGLQEELEALRAERDPSAAYKEWQHDSSTGESWPEVKAEFIAKGLIDV